jgi:hypothetical protein
MMLQAFIAMSQMLVVFCSAWCNLCHPYEQLPLYAKSSNEVYTQLGNVSVIKENIPNERSTSIPPLLFLDHAAANVLGKLNLAKLWSVLFFGTAFLQKSILLLLAVLKILDFVHVTNLFEFLPGMYKILIPPPRPSPVTSLQTAFEVL